MSLLGLKIKHLRELNDMKMMSLAEKTKKPQSYLSQIENGKANPSDDIYKDILTKGFSMDIKEAKKTIDQWRMEEILSRGNITIQEVQNNSGAMVQGQGNTFNNDTKATQAIEMKKAGLSEEFIKDVLKI